MFLHNLARAAAAAAVQCQLGFVMAAHELHIQHLKLQEQLL